MGYAHFSLDKKLISLIKNLSLFLLLLLLLSTAVHAQDEQTGYPSYYAGPLKVSSEFFRSKPFDRLFSQFLDQLLNDPLIINKLIEKRTDSNFFSFKGEYKKYSPFLFLSDRTEIRLMETEIVLSDSLNLKDTILTYQLAGYAYHGKEGLDDVKKEFDRFNRKYARFFSESNPADIKNKDEIIGGVRNYFISDLAISPVSVGWARLDEFQNVFTVTLRIKNNGDMAVLTR
jgi:hypothetical protein